MVRYEANPYGQLVEGEPFTNFNEVSELEKIFDSLRWQYTRVYTGRGGYLRYKISFDGNLAMPVHIYIKRITFGGRANRVFEKRAQFSGALQRTGFDKAKKEGELGLILGIYKSDENSQTILCAWDIKGWGYNPGRAFNCFVDVHAIAGAIKRDLTQYITATGQIVCCFTPQKMPYYINNIEDLHKHISHPISNDEIEVITSKDDSKTLDFKSYQTDIPRFEDLFQNIIDVLKRYNGTSSVDAIEKEVGDDLNLTDEIKLQIHNTDEGYRTELGYRLAWSRYYLKKALLIQSPKRGIWLLTELGWDIITINREEIIKAATQKEIEEEIEKDTLYLIEEENGVETEKDLENLTIDNPFDPNLVDIRTRTMSLDLLIKRLKNEEIDMNTSFQRKSNLWNITKQSRLIESILVKFPLPAFYFDGSNDDKWLVVDGLQRLSSLDNYVNKQAFGLKGLEFLSDFDNVKFSELPSYLQRRIQEFEVTAYVIAAGTPKELKFNVFKRINTGGLTLTSQEIRNALNQGISTSFIAKLAGLRSFKTATAYGIPEERMMDQEFITRFLAFYLFPIEVYNSDLDSFLNKAVSELNDLEHQFSLIEADFDKSMQAAVKIFGDYAFRKRFSKDDKRKPINKALFEVWSVLLSKLSTEEIDHLIINKEKVNNAFINLLDIDIDFNKAISAGTGEKSRVRKRFTDINKIIQSILLQP
jgi:hypothetical protein